MTWVFLLCVFVLLSYVSLKDLCIFNSLKVSLSLLLVYGRKYHVEFAKAVTLGIEVNTPQSLAKKVSLIDHEMFAMAASHQAIHSAKTEILNLT